MLDINESQKTKNMITPKSYLVSAYLWDVRWAVVAIAVDKNELKLVLERLDTVKLELLRLRAMLLPEEEATTEEKKAIREAKKDIEKGQTTDLKAFIQELGC